MEYTYVYYVASDGEDDTDERPFTCAWDDASDSNRQFIAEAAAEYWHDEADGWFDEDWPKEFVIRRADGRWVGRFKVLRDVRPVFEAYAMKEPT